LIVVFCVFPHTTIGKRLLLIGRDLHMCYNCGCQMPDNDMGKAANVTNKTLAAAAKAEGQSVEEAKKNALDLLKKFGGETQPGGARGRVRPVRRPLAAPSSRRSGR